MYEWVGYTWNPLAGECPHDCEYCYVKILVKRFKNLAEKYTGPLRIDEKALNARIPKNRTVFVCSMSDLFAEEVPEKYIKIILNRTRELDDGTRVFLFQTKNPTRFKDFLGLYPKNSIFGTTIETNYNMVKTRAPPPLSRYLSMLEFANIVKRPEWKHNNWKIMVSIEPILRFDLDILVEWIGTIHPDFVSIGADSKGNNLDEPCGYDVVKLINSLRRFTEVKVKKNLYRIASIKEVL